MPAKNVIKTYVENGYYHVYNRGVEKRTIFQDSQDYKVFLNLLKTALMPPPKPDQLKQHFTLKGVSFKGIPYQPKNFLEQISLLAYCLMPNHFHLLIKQQTREAMQSFMRSISTRYATYFNKRFERTGTLFQGTYRAVQIETDEQFLHLSRYIHQNPLEFWEKPLKDYPYSSYAEYLGLRNTPWIHIKEILAFFRTRRKEKTIDFLSYESFVDHPDEASKQALLNLTID